MLKSRKWSACHQSLNSCTVPSFGYRHSIFTLRVTDVLRKTTVDVYTASAPFLTMGPMRIR